MPDRVRSHRQAQRQRAARLRSEGKTWAEVATDFRAEYGVNARVALRLAHGWSQGDVADRWNDRWPDDPKTFKNISYWERWPAASGYTPSLDVLMKLSDLYECHVAELLADGADFREKDPVFRAKAEVARLPAIISLPGSQEQDESSDADVGGDRDALAELVARLEESDVQDIAREAAIWAAHLDSSIDRRSLLLKLGFALTVAAAGPAVVPGESIEHPVTGEAASLSGVWRSEYGYYSTGRGQQLSDTHYVVVRQQGAALTVESLPHTSGSQLVMHLAVDGMTATGTWEERTSPTGYYKGAVYRGAMQLLIEPSGGRMTGRWLGFGKNFQINNGDWTLTLETRSLSRRSINNYELKV